MSSHPHSSAGNRDTGETAHAVQKASLISVLLTPPEAARLPHTNAGVLAVWRNKGKLPLSFVRVERRIFYKAEDIQKFIELRTVSSTSEPTRTVSTVEPETKPRRQSRRKAA
jgi:hypothetical protein